MLRVKHLILLAGAGLILAGCVSPARHPAATASPNRTGNPPPWATVSPARLATGVRQVDSLITAALARDSTTIARRVKPTVVPCAEHDDNLRNVSYQFPACGPGEHPGDLVPAFHSTCGDDQWQRFPSGTNEAEISIGSITAKVGTAVGVYAVFGDGAGRVGPFLSGGEFVKGHRESYPLTVWQPVYLVEFVDAAGVVNEVGLDAGGLIVAAGVACRRGGPSVPMWTRASEGYDTLLPK